MNLLCFTCVGFGVWFDWWQLMTQRLSSLYVDTLATANALPGCWCWRYTTRSNWPPARKMSRVLGLGSSSNANLPMAKSNGAIDTPISDTQRYPQDSHCARNLPCFENVSRSGSWGILATYWQPFFLSEMSVVWCSIELSAMCILMLSHIMAEIMNMRISSGPSISWTNLGHSETHLVSWLILFLVESHTQDWAVENARSGELFVLNSRRILHYPGMFCFIWWTCVE